MVGEAFSFDGVNDYVKIANAPNLNFGTGSFSIDFWINYPTAAQTVTVMVHGASSSVTPSEAGWAIGLQNNQLVFDIRDQTGQVPGRPVGGTAAPLAGQWHHVALVIDRPARIARFYVNGAQTATATISASFGSTSNNGNPAIGAMNRGGAATNGVPTAFFNGLVDEVESFNRALSASEIQAIFDAGSAGKCKGTAPIANAGPDQTVEEGDLVILDGSGSSDPDGDPLTYEWTQVAGPAASLNLTDPIHPTFVAPNVPRSGATVTFELTVHDGEQTSDPDTVDITVKDVNNPPVADAGNDQTVQEGSPVALDGSNSFDFDSDPLTYSWIQTSGPSVTLSGANTAQPSFTAPLVGPAGETLTFELTVDDGVASHADTVDVVISNVNQAPIADAGADQTKDEGSLVTLDGTASSDPDADPLIYTWTQVSGPSVTLSARNSPTPTFTAPLVSPGGATLEFELNVNDGVLDSDPDDRVTVTARYQRSASL